MAKKNPDLSQALKTLDNRAAPAPKAEKPAPIEPTDNPHYRPSRQGMENLTGYFPPEVKNQLMELAIERRRAVAGKVTIQDLLAEALNDLFAKYGKPEIAPLNRKEGQGS